MAIIVRFSTVRALPRWLDRTRGLSMSSSRSATLTRCSSEASRRRSTWTTVRSSPAFSPCKLVAEFETFETIKADDIGACKFLSAVICTGSIYLNGKHVTFVCIFTSQLSNQRVKKDKCGRRREWLFRRLRLPGADDRSLQRPPVSKQCFRFKV